MVFQMGVSYGVGVTAFMTDLLKSAIIKLNVFISSHSCDIVIVGKYKTDSYMRSLK